MRERTDACSKWPSFEYPRMAMNVFISYSSCDSGLVKQLEAALKRSHIQPKVYDWDASNDPISSELDRAIGSNDVIAIFLSPPRLENLQKDLFQRSLKEMRDRAITVFLVITFDHQTKPSGNPFDLRSKNPDKIEELSRRISLARDINLSNLTPQEFEKLVVEILAEMKFEIKVHSTTVDDPSSGEFMAFRTTEELHGEPRRQAFLVEVKSFQTERVDLRAIKQLSASLMGRDENVKGLFVTNGRLTSVARDYLSESATKTRREIEVLERDGLTSILLDHPVLAQRYFPVHTWQ